MDKDDIIKLTKDYVKQTLSNGEPGHDWWHVYRVRRSSFYIGRKENADLYIVELGALLHDVADWKFNAMDDSAGSRVAREWLVKLGAEQNVIDHVCDIVDNISFKGAGVDSKIKTIEGMVVQDADRLDAIGAIGIARAFTYTGFTHGKIYDLNIKPKFHKSFDEYKKNNSTAINHFYEKLLLLKDLMNTATGKMIAEERHKFMENYLGRFFEEWDGLK